MSPECMQLAEELAAPVGGTAFRVYLPRLFGEPAQTTMLGMDFRGLFCIRREMHYLASSRTSPMTTRLRRLVVEITENTNTGQVAVIGMCLTGNLVFGLMAESTVGAAVSSQPSLPFPILRKLTPHYKRAALSVSDRDLVEAVRSRTPLLAFRFEDDWMCPRERFASLRDAFGDDGRLRIVRVPGSAHSVLTADRTDDNDMVPVLRQFLTGNLDGS